MIDTMSECLYLMDRRNADMKKPYIVCYMMTSIDGRIDCAMVGQLIGVEEYYATLKELNLPSTLSGRVTAQLEMALLGIFQAIRNEPFGKEGFFQKLLRMVMRLLLIPRGAAVEEEADAVKPHLIITREQVPKEYLGYLDKKRISWIACGKEKMT